jgi:hypothetical protein
MGQNLSVDVITRFVLCCPFFLSSIYLIYLSFFLSFFLLLVSWLCDSSHTYNAKAINVQRRFLAWQTFNSISDTAVYNLNLSRESVDVYASDN